MIFERPATGAKTPLFPSGERFGFIAFVADLLAKIVISLIAESGINSKEK